MTLAQFDPTATLIFLEDGSSSAASSLFIAPAVGAEAREQNETEITSFILLSDASSGFVVAGAAANPLAAVAPFTDSIEISAAEISATNFDSEVGTDDELIAIGTVVPSRDALTALSLDWQSFLQAADANLRPRYVPGTGSGDVKPLLLIEAGGCDIQGGDGTCDTDDLDTLVTNYTLSNNQFVGPGFKDDLNGDTYVNMQDLHTFRAQAGLLAGYEARHLMGDTDLNGVVDFDDFLRLSAAFDAPGTTKWSEGNFDAVGIVDFDDFLILAANYGLSVVPTAFAAAVPEPESAWSWLAILLLSVRSLRVRARRSPSSGSASD